MKPCVKCGSGNGWYADGDCRLCALAAVRPYRETPAGIKARKATQKLYRTAPEKKEANRLAQQRRRATAEGKEADRLGNARYRATPKGKDAIGAKAAARAGHQRLANLQFFMAKIAMQQEGEQA